MEILIIAFLILLNGIFSMSEIALVSSRKYKLEGAARKGNKTAQKALELASKPNTFLSTVQIGITLIGILIGIFSGERVTDEVSRYISTVPLFEPYAQTLAVVLVVVVVTYFSIIFGELVPKRIGLTFPEKIASLAAAPMELISKIAKPFIWLLAKTSDLVFAVFGIRESRDETVSEEEITSMIRRGTQIGEIQKIEHDIVKRVFVLGDRKVRELMTHRLDIKWFDINDSLETIRQKTEGRGHTVYPVANRELDKLAGVIYLKELFSQDFRKTPFRLADYIKKPVFVHENLPVYDLLEQLKRKGVNSAIVIDEYGAVEGMVSLYDVFDALVGDSPQQEDEETAIMQRDENSWLADGQFSFYELVDYLEIEEEAEERSFTTLAGLILHLLNHIPITGEKTQWNDFELEIVDMDGHRIDKVLISRVKNRRPAEE